MVPACIPIKRVAYTATHHIGRHEDGLFMGLALEVFPERKKPAARGTWYAVLHKFESNGAYFETEHFRDAPNAHAGVHFRLGEMIRRLTRVSFEDIAVPLFDVKIDGTLFGLVDVSDPVREDWRVELFPCGVTFSNPWNGLAETKPANQLLRTTGQAKSGGGESGSER